MPNVRAAIEASTAAECVWQGARGNTQVLSREEREVSDTYPTLLSPWFVVVRQQAVASNDPLVNGATELGYWTTDGETAGGWSRNRHQAMLFMSLHSASRVAEAEPGSLVVALYNKAVLKEYRPREFDDAQ